MEFRTMNIMTFVQKVVAATRCLASLISQVTSANSSTAALIGISTTYIETIGAALQASNSQWALLNRKLFKFTTILHLLHHQFFQQTL